MSIRIVNRLREWANADFASLSPATYSFAIICVAVAASAYSGLSHFAGNVSPSIVFCPAVLIAALVGGVRAGAVAIMLSTIMVWWTLESAYFETAASSSGILNQCLYVAATALIIWIAERYRRTADTEKRLQNQLFAAAAAIDIPTSAPITAHTLLHRHILRGGLPANSFSAYAFAFACIAVATLVRFGLSWTGDNVLPFASYYPAILLATLVGGLGAGIAASALSVVLIGWAFFPPYYTLVWPTWDQAASLGLFIASAVLCVLVSEHARRALSPRVDQDTMLKFGTPSLVSLAAVVLTTVVLLAIDSYLQAQHLVIAYLLPTTVIAIFYGSAFAFATSFASGIAAAYFLFPPKFSLYIAEPLHIAELGFFMLLAMIASKVVAVLTEDLRVTKAPQNKTSVRRTANARVKTHAASPMPPV